MLNLIEKVLRKMFPASWAEHDARMAELDARIFQNEVSTIMVESVQTILDEAEANNDRLTMVNMGRFLG